MTSKLSQNWGEGTLVGRLSRCCRHLKWGGAAALLMNASLQSCQAIKPYEKEFLLNPLMEEKGLSSLVSPMASSALVGKDFLASGSPQATASSSCPTCGG